MLLRKGKEMKSIYIALFWQIPHSQSTETWITQFYLQITPCLPFLRKHSPDGAIGAVQDSRYIDVLTKRVMRDSNSQQTLKAIQKL